MVAIYGNPYCGTGLPVPVLGKDVHANAEDEDWQHLRPECGG
jgi:hypothetical protein